RAAIEPGGGREHHVGRGRAPGDIGAVVDDHVGVAGEEPPGSIRRRPYADDAGLAGRAGDELLEPLEGDLDGATHLAREQRGDDVDGVEVEPAAEVAADRRLDNQYAVAGGAEGVGEGALVEAR